MLIFVFKYLIISLLLFFLKNVNYTFIQGLDFCFVSVNALFFESINSLPSLKFY